MKPLLAMASAILLTLACNPAQAAQRIGAFLLFPDIPDAIVLDGDIDASAPADLANALRARPATKYVILRSRGGYVDSALRMASMIQGRGLNTVIPSSFHCLSACAYLFFAGREHYAAGKLGVHRVGGSNNASAASAATDTLQSDLRRYRIPKGVMQRLIATPAQSMYVFSRKEISALSINRGGSARALELASR